MAQARGRQSAAHSTCWQALHEPPRSDSAAAVGLDRPTLMTAAGLGPKAKRAQVLEAVQQPQGLGPKAKQAQVLEAVQQPLGQVEGVLLPVPGARPTRLVAHHRPLGQRPGIPAPQCAGEVLQCRHHRLEPTGAALLRLAPADQAPGGPR